MTLPTTDPADLELAATLHALAAPFLRGRVEAFIDHQTRAIDFAAMLDRAWSRNERAMIEIACTLWGRTDIADASLSPVIYTMDDENFHRVLEALQIRRGNPRD